MAKNKSVIDKGAYAYYQAGAFVEVKNFIITEKDDGRYLLLQFENKSDINVDSIKFSLIQLDCSGEVISKEDHAFSELKMRGGKDYALKSGLKLRTECNSFRVYMIYAACGKYQYVFRNGQAIKYFDPRANEKNESSAYYDKGSVTVSDRRTKVGRINGVVALLATLIVIAACAYVGFMGQGNFGKKLDAETDNYNYDIEFGGVISESVVGEYEC